MTYAIDRAREIDDARRQEERWGDPIPGDRDEDDMTAEELLPLRDQEIAGLYRRLASYRACLLGARAYIAMDVSESARKAADEISRVLSR